MLRNRSFGDADPCIGAVGRSIDTIEELADAIDLGLVYWNLHTAAFPAGELRGQAEPLIRVRGRNRGDERDDEDDEHHED